MIGDAPIINEFLIEWKTLQVWRCPLWSLADVFTNSNLMSASAVKSDLLIQQYLRNVMRFRQSVAATGGDRNSKAAVQLIGL